MKNNNKTSWGNVADWYDKHLSENDTYHARVIAPNILRLVGLKQDQSLLELGCGQGYFLEKFSVFSKNLYGVEIGSELVKIAKSKNSKINYLCASAEDAKILSGRKFDVILIILALQNMKDLNAVAANLSRLIKNEGKIYIVLNHPAFRVPQNSDWGFDENKKVQYRRVDKYLSEHEILINMNPGNKNSREFTKSFHRPLQVYSKIFSKHGMAITKIEEWISHRESDPGPRAVAENIARKEIPLFMCLELRKFLQ